MMTSSRIITPSARAARSAAGVMTYSTALRDGPVDGWQPLQAGIFYETAGGKQIRLDDERDGGHIGTGGGLRTLDWTYETGVRSIRGQSKPVREVSVSITFASYDDADAFASACNGDVAAGTPGRITTGIIESALNTSPWYARAYITDMSFDTITPTCIVCSATVVLLDGGVWYRDSSTILSKSSAGSSYDYLDYPHGYDYDFLGMTTTDDIVVESSSTDSVDIRIVVQGPAVNPYVMIDGNRYEVDDTIDAGWTITIDTREKTIIKSSDTGIVTNDFALGVRGDGVGSGTYVFERLRVGRHTVAWSSSGNIEVTVYDERCLPPWSIR